MRRPRLGGSVACALLAAAAATAQAQAWQFTPSVTLSETWSDNVRQQPEAGAREGWITTLTPELLLRHAGARARLAVDARVHGLHYSVSPAPDSIQKFLNATGTFEAVDNWLFLDARAAITQERTNAFAPTFSPEEASAVDRVEARIFQAGPRIRGRLTNNADYHLRYTASELRTEDETFPRTRSNELVGSIRSTQVSRIGWSADLLARDARSDLIDVEDARARGIVSYHLGDWNLRPLLTAGWESTDVRGFRESGATRGAGLEWSPSERTQFAGVYEKRFFGNGHSVTLTHRAPRSLWRLTSTSDVSLLPTLLGAGALSVDTMLSDLLAAAIPDPVARARTVQQRLDAASIPGSSPLSSAYLNERPVHHRDVRASVALLGANNTVSFGALHRDQRTLGEGLPATSNDDVRQRGFNLDWSTRLTRLTSVTFATTWLWTEGLASAAPETRQRSATALLTTRLAPRTRASLGVRHTRFESNAELASYRESAVFASITFQP